MKRRSEAVACAILLFFASAAVVVSIDIISNVPFIYVLNGQGPFYSNNTVTFRCNPTDTSNEVIQNFPIEGNDGFQHNVRVTCLPTEHLYLIDIKGYTHYTGQLQRLTYCTVQANFNWNNSAPGEFTDPMGRRLLQVGPPPTPDVGTITRPNTNIDVVRCGVTQGFNQFLGGFASGVFGPTTSASGCGGPFLSVDSFNAYVDHQEKLNQVNKDTWESQARFNGAINDTFATIGKQFDIVNQTLAGIAVYMDYTNNYVISQAQYNANTTAFVTTFARSVNADLIANQEAIGEAFTQITGVTDAMAQIVNTTSSNFEQLTLALAKTSTFLTDALNNQAEQISFLTTNMVLNNLQISTQFLRLQSLVMNIYQNVQMKRDVAKLVQVSIEFVQSQGQVPFMDDLGVPPPEDIFNLPPVVATTVINVITKQFLFNDSTNLNRPTMRSVEFAWKCSTAVIGANPQLWGGFTDALNSLGPYNCTGPTGNDGRVCGCWIDVEDTQARIECNRLPPYSTSDACVSPPPGGLVPSPNALTYWENGLNPEITVFIPGATPKPTNNNNLVFNGNANNIVPGKFNGVRITSAEQYLNISAELCHLGISDSYKLWINGGGGVGPGYRIYSAFNASSMSAPFDESVCDLSIKQAMQPPAQGPFSTLYAEMQFAVTAFNLVVQSLDNTLLFGSIPNYLTWETIPTATLAGGEVNTCWVIYYMAFDPITTNDPSTAPYYNSVPVSTLEFVSTTASMRIKVDDGPEETVSATDSNPSSILLPNDGFVVLGDPILSWTGQANAKTYNPPQTVLPLNPAKQGTCGTPIYDMMPSPFNLTRNAWSTASGYSYDHRCGTGVPSLFEVQLAAPVLGLPPQCDPSQPNPAATGSLCNLLSRYSADAQQTGTGIKFVIFRGYPGPVTGDTTTAPVQVPAGEIRNIVNTACPTSTQVLYGSNTVTVIFTNGLTTVNRIRVVRRGACPITQLISLPPLGQGAPFVITFCPGTAVGQQEVLDVATVDGNGAVLQLCSNVTVTVDVQQLGTVPTAASFNTTQQYQLAAVDSMSTGLGQVQNALIAFQWNAIMNLYTQFPRIGLALDQFAISNMTATYNQIVALNQASQASYNANRARVTNYTGLITDYEDAYEANAQVQSDLLVAMQAKLNEVLGYNAQLSEAGQVLDQQQLLLAYYAGQVAANVTTLAYFTDQPVNYPNSGSDPLNVGDLLGEFGTGLANGIGAAAREIAKTAGEIIKDLASLPSALLGLITTTLGLAFIIVGIALGGIGSILGAAAIYLVVTLKKDFDTFKTFMAAGGRGIGGGGVEQLGVSTNVGGLNSAAAAGPAVVTPPQAGALNQLLSMAQLPVGAKGKRKQSSSNPSYFSHNARREANNDTDDSDESERSKPSNSLLDGDA